MKKRTGNLREEDKTVPGPSAENYVTLVPRKECQGCQEIQCMKVSASSRPRAILRERENVIVHHLVKRDLV